jgi:predicted Zn-dependent protease
MWLGHLAWWYYVAGDYATASKLFDLAVQLRPGEASFSIGRAWAQIEERRYSDAIQALDSTSESGTTQAERTMALACAYWLSKQPDAALSELEPALQQQPEWGNARWTGALYSPRVVETIGEMQNEAERRRKAQAATR